MKFRTRTHLLWLASLSLSASLQASDHAKLITKETAIQVAMSEVGATNNSQTGTGLALLGIRFDEPDTQWDVFVKAGEQAYEVEVDALSGAIIAAEAESLAEVEAELAGDLTHEGVAGDIDP